MNNSGDFLNLEALGVLANIMQVLNFCQNLTQTQNDEIMKALEFQNKIYLAEILEQNKKIMEVLKIDSE